MDIVEMKITDIIPYENNPRRNEEAVDKVALSISSFGFKVPIIVDKNNVIVAGHTRLKAAEKLGLTTVPTIRADDLTDDQIKAFRLADNKVSEFAEWDFEALEKELDSIEMDMSLFGFEDESEDEMPEVVEDDFNEEPPADTQIKVGDIFQLGEHRLMCGDSTDPAVIDRLMDGVKADMVFTSPPYNGDNTSSDGDVFNKKKSKKLYGNGYSDNLESSDYIKFCKIVLGICFDVTDGFIFWNVNYNANSRFEYIAQIQDKLEYLIEQIAWIKTSAIPLKGTMRRAWEPIYLFSTNRQSPKYDGIETNKWDVSNTNCQTSDHKACFPVELVAKGIKIVKPKSGVVFDPFGGSGSTLIACEQLNRKCYMCELDPHYCDVIIQRWEKLTGQKAVKLS